MSYIIPFFSVDNGFGILMVIRKDSVSIFILT